MTMGAVAGLAMMGSSWAGTVTVNGSTTVLPAMQQVAEAFMAAHKDVTVTISGTGSGNGIKALRDKMTDVAMTSRDMKAKETQDFESHGMKPVRFTVAYDAIIPVINKANPVAELSKEQLRDIYAGKIKSWKEVGGRRQAHRRDRARLVVRHVRVLAGARHRQDPRLAARAPPEFFGRRRSGRDLEPERDRLHRHRQTKAVKVEGVEATMETAKAKTWPISRDLFLFTIGEPQGDAKALIDFMMSADGQALVQKSGFVPTI